MQALILAGGSGTRLWPLSRQKRPKQLLSILGETSLMEQTVRRLAPVVNKSDVWVVTGKEYSDEIEEHCPGVPKGQIINEPIPLGTCLAVGLGLTHLTLKHPEEVVIVGWADSYIGNESNFHAAIETAQKLLDEFDGVILSVPPTYPATGYGYIETGEAIRDHEGAYHIRKFEEKPVHSRAEKLVESGNHFWNTGISVWKASKLLSLMAKHTPDHYKALEQVTQRLRATSRDTLRIEERFAGLDRVSIDNAIFEKADRMATIAVDLEWSDIGSWSAVHDILAADEKNVTSGPVVTVDTEGCLIFSQKRLVATLGVSDLVIVETDDAVLVARRDDAERMKELYDEVKKFGGDKYL